MLVVKKTRNMSIKNQKLKKKTVKNIKKYLREGSDVVQILKMKPIDLNPWNVHSLYDFCTYFNCPCCEYKNSSKQDFVHHAYCFHPESDKYLRNITDGSINDVDFPPEINIRNKIKTKILDINVEEDDDRKKEDVENQNLFEINPVLKVKKLDDEEIYCYLCDQYFCELNLFQEHQELVHNLEYEEPFDDLDPNLDQDLDQNLDQNLDTNLDHLDKNLSQNLDQDLDELSQTNKTNKCKYCGKLFTFKSNLTTHIRGVHGNEKDFKCDICGRSFFRAKTLRNHINVIHENQKEYKCDYCSTSFEKSVGLKKHIQTKHQEEFKANQKSIGKVLCEKCKRWVWNMRIHNIKKHNEGQQLLQNTNSNGKVQCEKCLIWVKNLEIHQINMHEGQISMKRLKKNLIGKIQCEKCHKWVKNLRIHDIKRHEGQSLKITCDICGRSFLDLETHIKRMHNVDKEKLLCGECGKEFDNKIRLKAHIDGFHKIQKKLQECQTCNKMFTKFQLKIHIRTVHDKIKDYICTICGKAFAHKKSFTTHNVEHSGIKEFECKQCFKKFYRNAQLQEHVKIVSFLKSLKTKIFAY